VQQEISLMTLEHGAVRDALITETLKLMEKGGLDTVKARVVAQLGGVSVGTIYNLFGNFDGLILAANRKIYEELGALGVGRTMAVEAEIRRKIAAGELPDTARARTMARLRGLAEAYVDFVAANANRWSALLAFNRTRAMRGNAENLEQLNSLIDLVGNVLGEVPRWRTAEERRYAARMLWSAVHGIVTMNFFGGDEATARARTSTLLEYLLTTLVEGMFEPEAA
jgi:AcrR family transcriptional regulator